MTTHDEAIAALIISIVALALAFWAITH